MGSVNSDTQPVHLCYNNGDYDITTSISSSSMALGRTFRHIFVTTTNMSAMYSISCKLRSNEIDITFMQPLYILVVYAHFLYSCKIRVLVCLFWSYDWFAEIHCPARVGNGRTKLCVGCARHSCCDLCWALWAVAAIHCGSVCVLRRGRAVCGVSILCAYCAV